MGSDFGNGERASKLSSMAETPQEDEDDEGFGDFNFVSYPSQNSQPNQINPSDANNGIDDEWGDFVNHSSPNQKGLGLSSGFHGAHSHLSETFDPFSNCDSEAVAGSGTSPWVKIRGALPLSIFGDEEKEEDEEGSGAVDFNNGNAPNSFPHNHADSGKKDPKSYVGVPLNDVIANLYNYSEQIKSPNGYKNGSNSVSNHVGSPSTLDRLNSSSGTSNSPLGGSNLELLFNGYNSASEGLSPEFVNVNEDIEDDDGWEFKGAEKESDGKDWKFEEHGNGMPVLSGSNVDSPRGDPKFQVGQETSEGILHSLDFSNGGTGTGELLSMSNGLFKKPSDLDCILDFKSVSEANGSISGPYGRPEHITEGGLGSGLPDDNADADDDIWEFKDASPTSMSKQEDIWAFKDGPLEYEREPKADYVSNRGIEALHSDSEFQDASPGSALKHKNNWHFEAAILESPRKQKEESGSIDRSPIGAEEVTYACESSGENKSKDNSRALPLSFFGDVTEDTDETLSLQNIFTNNSNSHTAREGPMPISDLISKLYSQGGETAAVVSSQNISDNGFRTNKEALDTDVVEDDDDFNDTSWEFRDALSEVKNEDKNPVNLQDINSESCNLLRLNEFVDFYSRLKGDLCLVVLWHLDALKSAKNDAAVSYDGARVVNLDKEIQEAFKELQQDSIFEDEVPFDSPPSKLVDLNEFLDVHQQKIHVFNADFDLSRRLLQAQKELKTAIELLKHAAAMLKILRMGSEDHSSYVNSWLQVLSACAHELQHGAHIWKNSLQKNVQFQILSEPYGQKYILALGEIYRVVEVIGASLKLYKPWALLGLADFARISAFMDECSTVWSSSGLQEVLESLPDTSSLEYDTTPKALLRCIHYVHDLDAASLQNHIISQQPTCQLSLLTQGTLPAMRMINWNGKDCFLKLANLWGNLVSDDPSNIPCKIVGHCEE